MGLGRQLTDYPGNGRGGRRSGVARTNTAPTSNLCQNLLLCTLQKYAQPSASGAEIQKQCQLCSQTLALPRSYSLQLSGAVRVGTICRNVAGLRRYLSSLYPFSMTQQGICPLLARVDINRIVTSMKKPLMHQIFANSASRVMLILCTDCKNNLSALIKLLMQKLLLI